MLLLVIIEGENIEAILCFLSSSSIKLSYVINFSAQKSLLTEEIVHLFHFY